MQERHLTRLDRLLAGANNALRTLAAPAGRPARPNPAAAVPETDLDAAQKSHAAGLMRVNHAGEVAAQGLYQGHAAVARDPSIEEQMQHAAEEEFDHLAWCEQRLAELDEKPSLLSPAWYMGAFLIGAVTGDDGLDKIAPFIVAPFQGVLCLFLLDMGLVAGRGLREQGGDLGLGALGFGLVMPLVGATLGLIAALLVGLSAGGAALLMTLSASASYIAVPAAMRVALPEARPSIYLTLSLGVTFPFNLTLGIPVYTAVATAIVGG